MTTMIALKFALFFALFIAAACSKDGGRDPVPAKANITGSVILYDASVTQVDKSGMKVSVECSSPLISATTDNNGKFTLTDVPFGTYMCLCMKNQDMAHQKKQAQNI